MPEYTGFQSILNAALGEYHSKGFYLTEKSDDVVMLYYKDEVVGIYTQSITTPLLQHDCEAYLVKLSSRHCHFDYTAHCDKPLNTYCNYSECDKWLEVLNQNKREEK